MFLFAATANAETQFVEDAVRQLLKARRVLKCSYVYGYYLDGPGYKKIVFEFMQVIKRIKKLLDFTYFVHVLNYSNVTSKLTYCITRLRLSTSSFAHEELVLLEY